MIALPCLEDTSSMKCVGEGHQTEAILALKHSGDIQECTLTTLNSNWHS